MTILGIRVTLPRIAIAAAIVAFSMLHPVIRKIVWFILPMGRGTDDMVFWIAFGTLCVVMLAQFINNFQPGKKKDYNDW